MGEFAPQTDAAPGPPPICGRLPGLTDADATSPAEHAAVRRVAPRPSLKPRLTPSHAAESLLVGAGPPSLF